MHFWQGHFNRKNRNSNKYQNTIAFANASCNRSCLYEKKIITALGRARRGNHAGARNVRH